MAERVYIGARYVPVIEGDWANTNAYEPLSVVLYNGDSYTSRQAVPIGVDISNTEYWAKSADYNAQVANLANDVDAVEADIVAIKANGWVTTARINDGAVTSAKIDDGAITTAKVADGAIVTQKVNDGAITAAKLSQDAIDACSVPLGYFDGAGYLAIGDGWTAGTGVSAGEEFVSKLATLLNVGLVYNYGVTETGFCEPGNDNDTFQTQVANAASQLSDDEKEAVHLITIMGGLNDWRDGTHSYADMRDASAAVANAAKTAFPNAYILFIPMNMPGYGANPQMFQYERGIISGQKGHARCAWVLGAWEWLYTESTWIASNNLTPTASGHSQVAYNIYKRLLNGGAHAWYDRNLSPSWKTGFSSDTANGASFQILNGIVQSYGMNVTNANSVSANTDTLIATVGAGACPLVNVYTPIVKGGAIVGVAWIEPDGDIYIRVGASMAAGTFSICPVSYIPHGKALH